MRRSDEHDDVAEQLYDLVLEGVDGSFVVEAIADALRAAAGVEKPQSVAAPKRRGARS